jgi:hypothetical protein
VCVDSWSNFIKLMITFYFLKISTKYCYAKVKVLEWEVFAVITSFHRLRDQCGNLW